MTTPNRYIWPIFGVLILAVVAVLLISRRHSAPEPSVPAQAAVDATASSNGATSTPEERAPVEAVAATPASLAAQVVSNKLFTFTRHRRELLNQMAVKAGVDLPFDVQEFFDAAEAGRWEEIERRYKEMQPKLQGDEAFAGKMQMLWGPVLSVYGAAEQAHKWPPQQLLDYGHTILSSLRPGMVYFGGTDEGRFIPELLSATAGGEQTIVMTQNSLVDPSYTRFLAALYGDRITLLSPEASEKAFQEYMADAQKRFAHDRDFPSEPKQVRPGERIDLVNNRFSFSGVVAVMAINERLLLALMQSNPTLTFGLQESFPLRETYGHAVPLGAIVEIGVKDAHAQFTEQRAGESVQFWREKAGQLASDPAAGASPEVMKGYAKLATAHANLLADWQHLKHAEEAYRLSSRIWPGNIESMGGLAELLLRTGRAADATTVMDEFEKAFPDRAKEVERTRARLRSIRVTAPLLRN